MEKSNSFIYKSIRMALVILMSISLLVSLQSEILYLNNLSYKFIFLILVFIVLIFIFIILPNKIQSNLIQRFLHILKKYQRSIFWFFYFLCALYQIFLLMNLKSLPHYDSSLLLNRLNDTKAAAEYLSINSNNLFIYFFNYAMSSFIGTSKFNFQIMNSFFIFISVVLFKNLVTKLFKSYTIGYISAIIFMLYSIIQPLYLVPYTDTYCLIPMFLSVSFIIESVDNQGNFKFYVYILLSSFFCAISYLLRPSCIIFIIAIFIFLIINLYKKNIRVLLFKSVPLFMLGSFATLFSFNTFIENQTILNLDLSKKVPITHFVLLGSSGNEDKKNELHGTWNAQDIKTTHSGKTTEEKSKLAWNAFKERTRKRGVTRTVKFYMQKYIQNTDSGVVGYHRDGLWIHSIYSPEGTFQNKIQQIYNEDGRLRPTFNFLCQIVWILTLIFAIIGTWNRKDWIVSLISLTIFGGLLFLLIFESGGTKYLFQYLPWIIILSSVGIDISLKKITSKKFKKAISEI